MKNSIINITKQFIYYKELGEATMEQLNDEELFWQYNDESNSIAIIVKHLSGNMLSRFTDFLESDGEKPWRQRDLEFIIDFKDRKKLLMAWHNGWACLINTLESLKPSDLEAVVYIRNMGHTVLEALHRQLAHYAYHVGQMVFIGKMLKGNQWQTLSIAKGQSRQYNQDKFVKPKSKKHFTDDL